MPAVNRESDTVAAINRVLDAERRMAEAVQSANATAEETLETARASRRRILERSRRRVATLHTLVAARLEEMLAQLEGGPGPEDDGSGASQTALEEATRRLAARLTSNGHERS